MKTFQEQPDARGSIGQSLRKAREAKGWSRRQFEIKTGISRMTVCHWERGDCCPPLDVALYLSRTYGVPLGELAGSKPKDAKAGRLIRRLMSAAEVQGPGTAGNLFRAAAEQLAILDERVAIMTEGSDEP